MSKSATSLAVTCTTMSNDDTSIVSMSSNSNNTNKEEVVLSSSAAASSSSTPQPQQYVFWNVAQPKTSYPQLVLPELDLITDDGSNSGSEATEENSVQREKYSSKVDQDVAVFMMIAEKLSVTSLVHLLQGHVRAQQFHTWHYDTLVALEQEKQKKALTQIEESTSSSSSSSTSDFESPKKKRRKSFRFATIRNGDVRTVVHEIESISTPEYINDIWWNGNEMMSFRCNAIDTVRHYRKHRKKYIDAIESIVMSAGSSSSGTESHHSDSDTSHNNSTRKNNSTMSPTVESAVKVLTIDSYARGLETHICTILSRARTEMIEALLEEQAECQKCGDSYNVSAESLRGQSLAYSTTSVQFAIALGHVDHIEALKAAMSVWTPEL